MYTKGIQNLAISPLLLAVRKIKDMDKCKELKVWQEAYKLSVLIYRVTLTFPRDKIFGITNQLRRAASSVCANITEGKGRSSEKSLIQFLLIAKGSLYETNYFSELSRDLGYLNEQDFKKIKEGIDLTGKLLNGFVRSLKNGSKKKELVLT